MVKIVTPTINIPNINTDNNNTITTLLILLFLLFSRKEVKRVMAMDRMTQ